MKEEIREFKEKFKKKREIYSFASFFCCNLTEEVIKDESLRMLDLRFEKLYGEQYLNAFVEALGTKIKIDNADFVYLAEKYNVKKINEHLIKIIEEYKQLIDELDAIIFADKEVGQNGIMSKM